MFQLEHELQEWTKRFSRMEVMRPGDIVEIDETRTRLGWQLDVEGTQ